MRSAVEIGYGLLQQGRYTEALPFLQRAVAEQPREARVHLYLALAYAHAGDNTNAEKHFAQAIALSPHDAYVFYNWGAYLHRQSRLPEALKAYETAYRLDPTLVGAKQAADSLRGGAVFPTPAAYTQPPTVAPSTPYQAQPPPVNPSDLYMPSARRYRSARGCISAGVLLSAFGLCVPPVGILGGVLCGMIALLRGSVAGGLVVMALAIVLGLIGDWIWQTLYEMARSAAPM
ncbi:MAG: tetratricopeptide repeat protein [Fimbriimonadales bacterium]|nr:tetratricopeptide repeat protein [Fimbriimonadales bacterium]